MFDFYLTIIVISCSFHSFQSRLVNSGSWRRSFGSLNPPSSSLKAIIFRRGGSLMSSGLQYHLSSFPSIFLIKTGQHILFFLFLASSFTGSSFRMSIYNNTYSFIHPGKKLLRLYGYFVKSYRIIEMVYLYLFGKWDVLLFIPIILITNTHDLRRTIFTLAEPLFF